jgi:hypothetical protein
VFLEREREREREIEREICIWHTQFGCPHAKDPRNPENGTGGPAPNSVYEVPGQVSTEEKREGGRRGRERDSNE